MKQHFLFLIISFLACIANAQDFYMQKIKTCSAGYYFSLAIDESGKIWGWGNNYYGQLTNGNKNEYPSPIPIKPETKFISVEGGGYHSLAIDEFYNLWAWGYNGSGCLGDGTLIDEATPIQIKAGTKFKSISAGKNHSLAIDENGNLWAWGENSSGQIGDGTTERKLTPIQIKSDTKFKTITAGSSHSLAIDELGNLWAWGDNSRAQLGDGTKESTYFPKQIKIGTKFENITAEGDHSLVIDNLGNLTVFSSWSPNFGAEVPWGSLEAIVNPLTRFNSIATGANHSLAIDGLGNLWAWGRNTNGELGDGTTIGVYTTTKQIKPGTKFKIISGGYSHSMAIDKSGNLWVWGRNKEGQLGDGTSVDETIPNIIMKETKFKAISTGNSESSFAIDEYGTLYGCGRNDSQILLDKNPSRSNPVKIKPEIKFKQVSNSSNNVFALDELNNLWAWGNNYFVQIKVGTKFKTISYNKAIDEQGNLWSWGYNENGEVGDGTTIERTLPVQIMVGTKFKTVTYSKAIDEQGNLWSWGYNQNGEVGDGTTNNRLFPVQIMPETKFKDVDREMAIDETGNIWVWGRVLSGYAYYVNHLTPVQITFGTKYLAIASLSQNLAIDEDGNLWGWGNNSFGELGIGNTENVYSPVKIKFDTKFKSIAVGVYHSMAIDEFGKLWTWGYNYWGELGNGLAAWSEFPLWLNAGNISTTIEELQINDGIESYGSTQQINVHSNRIEKYKVFNILGQLVSSGQLQAGETNIPMQSGIYIFSTGSYQNKLLVK